MGFFSTVHKRYGTTFKLIGAAVIPKRWDSDFSVFSAFLVSFVTVFLYICAYWRRPHLWHFTLFLSPASKGFDLS